MAYIFERQTGTGLIKDAATGTVLITASSGTIHRTGEQITIALGVYNFVCEFTDIQSIGGVVPSDSANAVELLYNIFPAEITAAEMNAIPQAEKGQPNGVGTLDATGKETLSESRILDVVNKGSWNATTNTPSLSNGSGVAGNYYVVSVAGTRNFGAGAIAFNVGDIVRYNGTLWEKQVNAGISPYGGISSGPVTIGTGTNGNKFWLAKWTSGSHQDAPTTLDANAYYMIVGGVEWNANSYRLIGFGYGTIANNRPVAIGYQEKTTSGNTFGDLIFLTRPTNTDVAPTIRARITATGQFVMEDPAYVPSTDAALVTRKYADRGRVGTTAQRPTGLLATDEGFQYYDSTLKKPIWWNGTHWTDATGTNV